MKKYTPYTPFSVTFKLLVPKSKKVKGVTTRTYEDGLVFNGSFRSMQGTSSGGRFKTNEGKDKEVDGLYVVETQALIDTWYHPDIKANCLIEEVETGLKWKIIGVPDDINRKHQYMQCRVIAYEEM